MAGTLRGVVAVAAVVGTMGAADAPPTAFGVGVLRRDGVIIPFATFNGKRWSSPWPQAQRDLTVPVTLSGVPSRWWGPTGPLEQWQARTADGPRTMRVLQPDWVSVHCARNLALRTDYRPAQLAPPRETQPYPKDGLAVSPAQDVQKIEVVSLASDEIRTLLPVLHESFNDAERRIENGHGHPISRRAREGIQPTIEALYAYGQNPRVYYVEATRAYRELGRSAAECAALGFGTGWFVRDEAGLRELTMAVDLLDCRREAGSYMLPLGVFRLNDRVYWLAQFSGWDHERYVVLELKKNSVDVVINKWGGAC